MTVSEGSSRIVSVRRQTRLYLDHAARVLQRVGPLIWSSEDERRCREWFRIEGDSTLRLDYDLDSASVVLDIGGYSGQWTSDIYARYCPSIHVFEPLREFANFIERRFQRNPGVTVHHFGLLDRTAYLDLHPDKDGTSTFRGSSEPSSSPFRAAADVFSECNFKSIDLMKINIEGGEYALLEHLIDTGWIQKIENIQVQFHEFVPKANERMIRIQDRLAATHRVTWQYPFVWENWQRIEE